MTRTDIRGTTNSLKMKVWSHWGSFSRDGYAYVLPYKFIITQIRTNNLNFMKTNWDLKLVIIYDPKAKQFFAHNYADSQTSINTVKQLAKQGYYPNYIREKNQTQLRS
jgi:hypothetical protein